MLSKIKHLPFPSYLPIPRLSDGQDLNLDLWVWPPFFVIEPLMEGSDLAETEVVGGG